VHEYELQGAAKGLEDELEALQKDQVCVCACVCVPIVFTGAKLSAHKIAWVFFGYYAEILIYGTFPRYKDV
jgi:hypothetical protein